MDKILDSVNKVYREEHPSFYVNINQKNLNKIIKARKNLLFNLKIQTKLFKDSKLLDFGSGSGIYGLVYNLLGAKTDLVEYEKNFVDQSKKLFSKFARKSSYKIYSSNIFNFKQKKKYDIVIFNGVAHHTRNPNKILDKACKFLKRDGMIIYGIGNKSGFFQRALQRLILFKLSKNKSEIIKFAKILFREHLNRAQKFGGRTERQIIFDTYINPKIDCQSSKTIVKIFRKNKLELYSSFPNILSNEFFTDNTENYRNFNSKKTKGENKKEIFLSEHKWITSLIELGSEKSNKQEKIELLKDKITNTLNDKNFDNYDLDYTKIISHCINYKKNLHNLFSNKNLKKNLNKYDKFYDEVIILLKQLSKKNCKIKDIRLLIKKNRYLFKGTAGVGMNYYVGYKL
tara:strand:- start:21794 stop:22993 length:1200 start_codon:yes stop_codon:yes gene_type:complete